MPSNAELNLFIQLIQQTVGRAGFVRGAQETFHNFYLGGGKYDHDGNLRFTDGDILKALYWNDV